VGWWWHTWLVLAGRHQEQVVDAVHDVLRLDELLVLSCVHVAVRQGTVHHEMGRDAVILVTCHELTTEGHHQELQGSLRNAANFSAEAEDAFIEKFSLLFYRGLLLGQSEQLWGVFKLSRNANLLHVAVDLPVKLFRCCGLQLGEDLSIEEQAVLLVARLVWWVAHANVLIKLKVDKSEECEVKLHEGADDLVVDVEGQSLIE
jgi:hypothetical protein